MSETENEMTLKDEDRLPWLEAVENDDDDDSVSHGKLIGFLLVGLAALGLVVGGVWWLRSQSPGAEGDGTLIAAQQGDYKVKPDAPGGMKVEGQGDSTFAASEGAEANGKVDVSAQPEAPVATQRPSSATPAKPVVVAKPAVTTPMPPSGGKLTPPALPGTQIQLALTIRKQPPTRHGTRWREKHRRWANCPNQSLLLRWVEKLSIACVPTPGVRAMRRHFARRSAIAWL
jgi:hypothetical protein